MATEFKSYAKASISNNSGTPSVIVDSSQVGANRYGVVIGLMFTNKSVATRYVTVRLKKSGGDTILISPGISLPPNTGYEVIDGGKLVLETGDEIDCYTDAATAVDIVVSMMVNDE